QVGEQPLQDLAAGRPGRPPASANAAPRPGQVSLALHGASPRPFRSFLLARLPRDLLLLLRPRPLDGTPLVDEQLLARRDAPPWRRRCGVAWTSHVSLRFPSWKYSGSALPWALQVGESPIRAMLRDFRYPEPRAVGGDQ